MELQLRRREERGVTLVEVSGEIDLNSAPRLREELHRACAPSQAPDAAASGPSPAPRVLVDLSRVPFIDSSGIGVLAGAFKRAREAGGQLGLLCPGARVRRVLEITGLLGVLPLWDSLDEALSALGLEAAQPEVVRPEAGGAGRQHAPSGRVGVEPATLLEGGAA